MHAMQMPAMAMPGGWTMSMMWMRMPDQTWSGAALMFIAMWSVMMVAMMLPVVAPALWRAPLPLRARLQLAGAYFAAWILAGVAAYPLGALLAVAAMREPALSRAVPAIAAVIAVLAAALQLSAWKRRQLACCRHPIAASRGGPWRQGWRLGLACLRCCAPLTAVLFVAGVMQPAAMAAATLAIAAERLLPAGVRIARLSGIAMLLGGSLALWRATLA
jgi:predicted metal-binding membrane protein